MNTFSQTISPSMRLGFMVLPPRLLERYRRELGFYACAVPALDQHVLARFLDRGHYDQHLSRMRKEYRARRSRVLEAFRAMMTDAAELRSPQWTEDPEDRPNLQFDLNLNGEDVTMVLCPCIVAGTEDKYLLVQKDSYMGRVTYTYYQTQQGDDYDRMAALFEEQYQKEPQTLTAAMAAQIRAQTAAISNLDWSDQFPLDENGILGGLPVEGGLLWCVTELVSREELDRAAAIIKEVC